MTKIFLAAPSRRLVLTGLVGGLFASPAIVRAHGYTAGTLEIDHPTITPTRGQVPVHAGYMTIINRGRAADRLLSATSSRARRIELHTHIREGDMMRMRPVEGGVAIPAGQTVRFAPGGLHLMIYDVTGRIDEGDAFPITLRFERAGAVDVVAMGETPTAGGHQH